MADLPVQQQDEEEELLKDNIPILSADEGGFIKTTIPLKKPNRQGYSRLSPRKAEAA